MSDKKMSPDEFDTYRDDLRELKVNNKPLINMLSQGQFLFKITSIFK